LPIDHPVDDQLDRIESLSLPPDDECSILSGDLETEPFTVSFQFRRRDTTRQTHVTKELSDEGSHLFRLPR